MLASMAAKKKKAKKKTAKPKKKKASSAKKKKAKTAAVARPAGPSPDDTRAFEPGKLVRHEDGKFSLIFTDFVHDDVFEEHGLQGGGYTWHGLVDHVLKTDSPHSLKFLDFDPEGSMFAVVSKDLAALHACAQALEKLQDPELVRK